MIVSARLGLVGLTLPACIGVSLLAHTSRAQATNECGDKTMCAEGNNKFGCCDNGGNCTWYAEYHAECIWGHPGLGCTGNANEWTECSGYAATAPLVGSIFVKTATDGYPRGHVGAVVNVAVNGFFDTNEQECDEPDGKFGTFTGHRAPDFAAGFIPVTDVNNSTYVTQYPEDDIPLPTSYNRSYSITLRNTGTNTWPHTYQLKLTRNDYAFTELPETLPVNTEVAPGEEHAFSWTMTTPSTPGERRRTWWRMIDADGNEFGMSAFISIEVRARGEQADACEDTMWCASGLTCVDGRCCGAPSCPTCQSCDIPGHLGACADDPYGHDDPACPDNGPCNGVCGASGGCTYLSTEVCTDCSSAGTPSMASSDLACGVIECDGRDNRCRDYHDLDGLNAGTCEDMGDCKDANTSDCTVYTTEPAEVCTSCDASGNPSMETDDAGCGIIDCDGQDTSCRNYHDLVTDRCEGMGDCKDANTADCTSYSNASLGTECRAQSCSDGVVHRADVCDGYGDCVDRGSYTCPSDGVCEGVCSGSGCGYRSTEVCTQCSSTGTPSMKSSDAACGVIDCDGRDNRCRDYQDLYGLNAGTCEGMGDCKDANTADCTVYTTRPAEVCTACDASGNPSMETDDANCGTIDCDGRDTACRNYHDLTTDRCEGMGNCKDANSTDCTSYSNASLGAECRAQSCSGGVVYRADICDGYGDCIDRGSYACPSNGVCQGVCAGSTCGYSSTQVCTRCSSSGTASAASDDTDCGTIDCDGRDRLCRNYHDVTSGRCEGMGNCKDANSSDCTSYTNWSRGSQCRAQTCSNGVVQRADTCDGYGNCVDQGRYTCSGNYNCNGSVCRTSCTQGSHCRSGYYCYAGKCYPSAISSAESSTGGGTSERAREPAPPAGGDMER